jgi:hypothetical protein
VTAVVKQPPDEKLVIGFYNEEPLELSTVASVLGAASSDYRRLTKRHLALFSAQQGSLHVTLVDAIAIAGGVVTITGFSLKDFVKIIEKLVNESMGQDSHLDFRSPGIKTVRSLIKASRDSSANIQINYEDTNQKIAVRLNRVDAERMWLAERARSERSVPKLLRSEIDQNVGRSSTSGFEQTLGDLMAAAAYSSDDPLQLEHEGNGALLVAKLLIAEQLARPDGKQVVPRVLRSLRGHGQYAAATLLERLIESLRPPN